MNKKKAKKVIKVYHPTQVELVSMVAKARKEAEDALRHAQIIEKNLQSIIDEANFVRLCMQNRRIGSFPRRGCQRRRSGGMTAIDPG